MYFVSVDKIRDQIRNCVVARRGDWLFNTVRERDVWLMQEYNISIWSSTSVDRAGFINEQEFTMFMLRWS